MRPCDVKEAGYFEADARISPIGAVRVPSR